MILESLELANFRKFRDPLRIEGFTGGLNIVVEPNETGKSTLLEALRAAFFVRHSAKTELVRSFLPIGDDVAPRVGVAFHAGGKAWTLEKQFMRAPYVRLASAAGRQESDAAEEALQTLLGFDRGNNRGTDLETRGPLGMLWVEQASALAVEGPNPIVRNSVRSVLESEVGAVTGGRRFDAIRANVETAYAALRTGRTRQSRGELAAAENRLAEATADRERLETALRGYEQALADLDNARARLKLLEREIVDPEAAEQRRQLVEDLKVGESAQLRLSAAEAQHGQSDEQVKAAEGRVERLDVAERRMEEARTGFDEKTKVRGEAKAAADAAVSEEKKLRSKVDAARKERERCEKMLAEARSRADAFARAAGRKRVIAALDALTDLEARAESLASDAQCPFDEDDLGELSCLERDVLEARARFEAGTVKVDVEPAPGIGVLVDGVDVDVDSIDILGPTRITLGAAGSILVRPPEGTGRAIEAELAVAEELFAAKLRALDVTSHAEGARRLERAGSAARELETVDKQIETACPGDPSLGLAPGADALRAFAAPLSAEEAMLTAPGDDLDALGKSMDDARGEEAADVTRHDLARIDLGKAEQALAAAAAELSLADAEAKAAGKHIDDMLAAGDREKLAADLAELQRVRAAKLEALEAARAGATSYDVPAIRRRIDNFDRGATRAGEERIELNRRIASLETIVLRDGTMGPAGQVAAAREEEDAAAALVARLGREADVLEHLRETLAAAAAEASRTFLAPVTRRAARYVERLLPGAELAFDEDLALASVDRAGLHESCADLSRGTQEQLAILTRLAFADLLLEDGAPVSLILDDPFVYSDDTRLETMTDILKEASERMQVILLTCRSKAFRHVDAHRIELR